jgi:D-alanyl-D-alanine carboxypeptidase
MPYSSAALSILARLGIAVELISAKGLAECTEATELQITQRDPDGREHLLAPAAAHAWARLRAAASEEGVELHIVSAFRSVERQVAIIERKLKAGLSIEQVLSVSAPPCFSEHHTGLAIDIGTPGVVALEPEFENTPAFAWLTRHAAAFGFQLSYPRNNPGGFDYEPWHWRFLPG